MAKTSKPAWLAQVSLALLSLVCLAGMARAEVQHSPDDKNFQVFAFNDLGMHCYDRDFSVFSLLPPFNVIHAQVILKGVKPKLLDSRAANLLYAGTPDAAGSINTTSGFIPGAPMPKTNFWDYSEKLFGVNPAMDVGILGAKMPNAANGPQPLGGFDSLYRWFSATGIPITNIDDQGRINSFPLMRIQAFDSSRQPRLRSSVDIVLPVSSEMNCAACHETDAFVGSNPGSASDASPPPRLTSLSPGDFSINPDAKIRFRENVLILHDALSGTGLVAQYQAGTPILCAQCHYSKALDLAGNDKPTGDQVGHLYLSRAIHKHHGTAWPTPGMDTPYTVPIPGDGVARCYYCHPGNDTQCLRSVMAVNGMQCQSCHGDLLAVAGFTADLANPKKVNKLPSDPAQLTVKLKTTGAPRRPWVDLPKCQSCHTGDAFNHQGPEIIGRRAYAKADADTASPILAPASRFAENQNLYRFSQTHGGVACEACHGSTHAEWPARVNSADNVTAMQLQGHTGEIAECGVCHGETLPPSLKGPHGLHNVNDSLWMANHAGFMRQNPKACQACHGQNLKGTVLSRAKADRILTTKANQPFPVAKGTTINCYDCHKIIR